MNKISRFFLWALEEHPGKLSGILAGFGIGLLVVVLGFWKALVLALFVLVGLILGKRHDDHKDLFGWLDRFFH
ncbi:DUF2273 domain-containing protein [Desulfitobacterium dichloroeliminans]|uniref:DUF2273 domain-containing protein n=1 Tax=Desulfitobacterium dichloroeliminans TaxID=233055 RepID=UPI001FA7DB19|nr:DUF2273 domain-containing protein [Desulfitobacterium dichloroeliminans]